MKQDAQNPQGPANSPLSRPSTAWRARAGVLRLGPASVGLLCLLLVLARPTSFGQSDPAPRPSRPNSPSPNPDDVTVAALVADEETLLALARYLPTLQRSLLDLHLPGGAGDAVRLFGPTLGVVDLAPMPNTLRSASHSLTALAWPLAAVATVPAPFTLWQPLLDEVSFFDHADFRLLQGAHPSGDRFRFESVLTLEATARMRSGEWRSVLGRVKVSWERDRPSDGRPGPWRIVAWATEDLRLASVSHPLFAESLEQSLQPPSSVSQLRRSQHYEATVRYYREGMKKPPHPYFAPISVNQKEGLAVADVNGDGHEDIYLTVRLGKNMLLINRGDGTFVEQAATYRLDLPGHSTCAIFADFDNDGDADLMLGRSLLRTSYLENRDGVFVQHPIPKFMPMAVISMAAADYNGDGLLDVYLCTYRPAAPAGSGTGGGYGTMAKEGDFDWPDEFFPPEQAREFRRRLAEHRQLPVSSALDQLGPPNVLLVNRGAGKFEPAPENATVGLWRNSLQATWCDYNQDGRPDLYIPNDWGLNVLFRNDGPAGFKDVTQEAGLTYYGFSMGASWGDYDNDGRDDLYISNMHSEAGRRMTGRVPGLDSMLHQSAMGNWLYHQGSDGRFSMVSGTEPPALTVMKAGWSWGGCFADFDNDGFLDLYVLNGYFTAPPELDSGLDLESNLWRTMLRADSKLTRPSFRFSPEWKRTPPPDSLGPQIDARLAGVERIGDRIAVHSLHGHERNRFFANIGGRAFVDASALSGLDVSADSRSFALLDYDRDGWLDLALANANQPLFALYRNRMASAGFRGGMIAVRFRGGNRTPNPSARYACRDGYGARVTLDLGDRRISREHRCGEGWSVQHSPTLHLGIGTATHARSLTVRWPSGHTSVTRDIPEGCLLTVYENPADAPQQQEFVRESYRLEPKQKPGPAAPDPTPAPPPPVFLVRTLDTTAPPARLRAYTLFATTSIELIDQLPTLKAQRERLGPEGVDLVVVPIDEKDDNNRLAAFHRQWKPTSRLLNLPLNRRSEALAVFRQVLGTAPSMPSTVVTDEAGQVLLAQPGIPSTSTLRRLLSERPANPP